MKLLFTISIFLTMTFGGIFAQTVTNGNDSGPGSLREEVATASSGATITFALGVTTVDLLSEITIDKNLTITGLSLINTSIDADNNSRIFTINSGHVVELNNLNLVNGLTADGAAIYNNANLTLNGCNISDCYANGSSGSGGAIYNNSGGVLTINNSSLSDNSAMSAGGAIEDNSGSGLGLILDNVSFTNNNITSVSGSGGAIHITGSGNVSITTCDITNNSAPTEGGGIWNGTGTMTITGSDISGNTVIGAAAAEGGGGIFNAGGTLEINDCTINNNSTTGMPSSGGGILNDMGVMTISSTTFDGNSTIRAGGAIEDNSMTGNTLTLDDVTIINNSAGASPGNGGGLHITGDGNAEITNSTFNANSASSEGGGIWNGAGQMLVVNTTVSNNTVVGNGADQGGAGLFNAGGTLTVDSCVVSGNSTSGTSTSGGGILNDLGVLTVSNTQLTGNSSIRAGGGIEDNSAMGNTLTLTDVTLSNNSTSATPGNGGGLHISGSGNSMIENCLITSNTAESEGGGLWNGTGTMMIINCDISNNTALGINTDNGGGGVFNNGGTLTINGGTLISGNTASGTEGSGGGILSTAGTVTIDSCEISGNSANRAGGGIELIDGDINFTASEMIDNDVNGTAGTANPGNGGGFHVTGTSGTLSFSNSTFAGNEAAREGGAFWNQSGATMTLTNCTVDGNSSFGVTATNGGAGIFNNGGDLTVTSSTISNNSDVGTSAGGAGVHNKSGGTVNIMTSTISGNSSSTGAGIYSNGSSMTINASTIAFNTASVDGGGIQSVSGVEIKNSIVSDNSASLDADVAGSSYTSNGYNLIGTNDNNIFVGTTGDLMDVDPMLVATLDLGSGTTATHSIQVGSPAYNAGDPADMFVDQNGQTVFEGRRDMGAVEAQEILGVEDLSQNSDIDIYVYPNPTTDEAQLVIPTEFGNLIEMRVHSVVTGELINSYSVKPGTVTIDLSKYPAGVYVVKMQSEKYMNNEFINKL